MNELVGSKRPLVILADLGPAGAFYTHDKRAIESFVVTLNSIEWPVSTPRLLDYLSHAVEIARPRIIRSRVLEYGPCENIDSLWKIEVPRGFVRLMLRSGILVQYPSPAPMLEGYSLLRDELRVWEAASMLTLLDNPDSLGWGR